MPLDRFFAKGSSHAELRFSAVCDACVVCVDDATPELVSGSRDDVEYRVEQRIAQWKKGGFKPVKSGALPEVQSPDVIAKITGLSVPKAYAAFLAEGGHRAPKGQKVLYQGFLPAAGNITKVPGFADSPIVFADPAIPFWLARFGWTTRAPNAIPIAVFEEGRALVIDAKSGEIFAFDDSASEPLVPVAKTMKALSKLVKR